MSSCMFAAEGSIVDWFWCCFQRQKHAQTQLLVRLLGPLGPSSHHFAWDTSFPKLPYSLCSIWWIFYLIWCLFSALDRGFLVLVPCSFHMSFLKRGQNDNFWYRSWFLRQSLSHLLAQTTYDYFLDGMWSGGLLFIGFLMVGMKSDDVARVAFRLCYLCGMFHGHKCQPDRGLQKNPRFFANSSTQTNRKLSALNPRKRPNFGLRTTVRGLVSFIICLAILHVSNSARSILWRFNIFYFSGLEYKFLHQNFEDAMY